MKSKWMMQAFLLTCGAAIALALMTREGGPLSEPGRLVAEVFSETGKPVELTDDNLVDSLSSLELNVPIAKVDLNGGILSVDLKVKDERLTKNDLYAGMADLISFAFARTTNIDQLLLRLIAEDQWLGSRYLLVAADVRRGEWPMDAPERLRAAGNGEIPTELKQWFRLTETALWRDKIH
ncbi:MULTISPECIES: hypothetical protein [Paenibacillus]|uniref:hypothetical protein n=1 Tax=Paenibacillus TaxID=44249 RepID=UPI002FE1D9BE